MKEKILHIIYITIILVFIIAACLIFLYIYNNKINSMKIEFDKKIEENNANIQLKIEEITNKKQEEYQNKIKNLMQYYNYRLQYGEKIKTIISMNDESYFDDLNLQVGDIYNSGTNRIVAFCSVLSGKEPEIGEIYHIEAFDEDRHAKETAKYSYQVILVDIQKNNTSDGSDFLELYFESIEEQDLKFTPIIRRVK